jgi:long-chain acyl-CoA synthetase
MLECTGARLDQLLRGAKQPDRIFHYLPFCFAGSRVLLLSALSRRSVLTLSTDLSKLSQELKLAAPDYFLNVPTLLERVRATIEEMLRKRGGFAAGIFSRAQQAYLRRHRRESRGTDAFWLLLANAILFPAIRKSIGPNLKALICGSAPLAVETQLFFQMLGIPVLQVYGLTETTAICTMDDPHHVVPGYVGPAIPGTEMKLAENDEIVVRGPHIFAGYWQRPEETKQALKEGWFHTGDQGGVDATGNWRITGRLKNLLILNSGHNIAPEPLEDSLMRELPEAQQIMLVGNQKSFLAALVTPGSSNGLTPERVQACIDAHNANLPHYKQVRAFRIVDEAFTIENGLLTANGKIKRDAVLSRHAAMIEVLYAKKGA